MSNELRYPKVVFFPKRGRPVIYTDVAKHDIDRLSSHGTFDLDPDMDNLKRYPIKYWKQQANNKVIVPKRKIAWHKIKIPIIAIVAYYAREIYEAIKSLGLY